MASDSGLKIFAVLAVATAFCVQGILGDITCESLDQNACAFAVSASGKRCVLEKQVKRSGQETYTCKTSEIEADKLSNWIESDQCIKSCGLDRKSLGISSDSLLESSFTQKLCSSPCYGRCPNIVDLYFSLAAGEGVFLPKLCEAQGTGARRRMSEIKSSGYVAPGPIGSVNFVAAPLSAPAMPPY